MRYIFFVLLVLLLPLTLAQASNQDEVNKILAMEKSPIGVVFEVVEGDSNALEWAIPAINHYVKQLRTRFPDIALAVVSHGSEQFGLMTSRQKEKAEVHKTVQSLVANDVPVVVCGTHASWRGKTASDFPDYVEVAPAGPTEIRNYEDMGYELIVLDK
ncbi:DsrE family protein [Kaarinaea lacus]